LCKLFVGTSEIVFFKSLKIVKAYANVSEKSVKVIRSDVDFNALQILTSEEIQKDLFNLIK